jgi:hypothetical protein
MSREEYLSRHAWLMDVYGLTSQEAFEAAYYDTDPETWVGSEWEGAAA